MNILKLYCHILLVLLCISCQEEEVTRTTKHNLHGYVQKGPFINGTTITIAELNDSLASTGNVFLFQVVDNKGSFSAANIEVSSRFLQLMASGYYYDEVKGEKSSGPLTLYALVEVTDNSTVNINLLSHLTKDRVIHLIKQGKSFAEAKKQAQQEVLAVFGIEKDDVTDAELLDISQDGEDNAILIAISAILQANNTVAELSELLANISTDIREDGKLDNQAIKAQIVKQSTILQNAEIRTHLEERYTELGVEAIIANFEDYIDNDGDGMLNKDDDDTPDDFGFTPIENAKKDIIYVSNTVTLSGLPYPTPVTVESGILILNGKEIKETTASVKTGDQIAMKAKASNIYGNTILATITIGSITKSFQVTTMPNPWRFVADFPNRKHIEIFAAFVLNDKIYFSTAIYYENQPQLYFYEFDPTTKQWTRKADFPGKYRYNAISFSLDKYGYIGAGKHEDQSLVDMYRYDPYDDIWTKMSDIPTTNVDYSVPFLIDDKAYLMLGFTTEPDFWEYNTTTDTWIQKGKCPSFPASFGFAVNGEAYVGGPNEQSAIWKYIPAGDQWTKVANYPSNIAITKGFLFEDKIYMLGSTTYPNYYCYTFDLDNHNWQINTYYSPIAQIIFNCTINGKGYAVLFGELRVNDRGWESQLWEFIPPKE